MIVDRCGGKDLGKGLTEDLDTKEAHPFCSPRTEVTLLLAEFMKMLTAFSGEGSAEAVEQVNECKNNFKSNWKKMYEPLYQWDGYKGKEADLFAESGIPKQLSFRNLKGPKEDEFDDELTADTTMRTERSLLSLLPASITNSKYSDHVELALYKGASLLKSVKELAITAGVKAKILKEPEKEKLEGPPFVNRGANIFHPPDPMRDYFEGVDDAKSSYLFWWTTFFVGTPIVVAAILISISVGRDAKDNIPGWLADVKNVSVDLELKALITSTRSRAQFVSWRCLQNRVFSLLTSMTHVFRCNPKIKRARK